MVSNKQLMATMIVFGVLIAQTMVLEVWFGDESFIVLVLGFMVADVIAAATYGIFQD